MSLKTRAQIRGARAMLSWSQERLAEAADVSLPTIKRLEPGDDPIRVRADILEKIERTLAAAGAEFTNGDSPGVRLRSRPSPPTNEAAA